MDARAAMLEIEQWIGPTGAIPNRGAGFIVNFILYRVEQLDIMISNRCWQF